MRSPLVLRLEAVLTRQPFWFGALLLCVLIVALWLPSLNASFQFDDWNVIVNDSRVHSLDAWLQSMPGIRPLLKLSYASNYNLSHDPDGFRLFNIFVHIITTWLVYDLFTRKTMQWGHSAGNACWAGLFTALIFALHSAQTEAVTYISGRSSSLCGLFSLSSIFAWARHESAQSARAEWWWLLLSCLALICAAAVKETALAIPLLLWLWSVSNPESVRWPKRLWLPALISIVLLVVALCMPTYQHLLKFSLNIRPLAETLLIQAQALSYLAGQLLRIDHMNADPQLHTVTHLTLYTVALSCAWLAAFALSLWRMVIYRHEPSAAAFALLWFLMCLLPTHSLLARLDAANDRQLYLALIGPAWSLSLSALKLHAYFPRSTATLCTSLFILLAISTVQRNRIYATELSFWQATAAQNPRNARAANNLGLAFALACRSQAAISEFSRAISLEPQDFHARINLMLLQQNQLPGVTSQHCDQDK